jgi:eukaryotic-like serine/threonine-protein kinase
MDDLPEILLASIESLSEHYDSFEQNRRGANGYLIFARNKVTGVQIAIKFYAGAVGETRHDEPKQLSAIRSKNVLPILDARNVSDEWGYFITPRCFEGDIDDLVARQPSALSAIDFALGICNGVSAIHKMKMVHRDLKPANIVLLDGAPQIADFGSVRQLGSTGKVNASQHSILFRPPESFASGEYGEQGDIYQIGLVTYQLLGGTLSYDGESYFTAKQRNQYSGMADYVDQSVFTDGVIRGRCESGKLLNFESLPPWVTGSAKRLLRSMVHHECGRRTATVADVGAALTQMRASMSNWTWDGDIARLVTGDKTVELRVSADAPTIYEPYLSKQGGPFRRAPSVEAATLSALVGKF